jgi:hypothetical protein
MIGGLCLGRDGVHLDTKGTRGDGVGDTGQYPSGIPVENAGLFTAKVILF